MPTTKAQQKAVNNYVRKHYDKICLTIPKGRKDELKAYAKLQNESMNAFVIRAIAECMQKNNGELPEFSSIRSIDKPALLSPDALIIAQEAANISGETVSQFIMRAIETQAKRDKTSIRMGFNLITQKSAQNDKKADKEETL